MKIYIVHMSTKRNELKQIPIILRDGFSFPAFVFTAVWAVWHKLWTLAVVIILIWIGGGSFLHYFGADEFVYFFVFSGFALMLGYLANDFLSKALCRQGFQPVGLVAAKNLELAFRRWATITALKKAASIRS